MLDTQAIDARYAAETNPDVSADQIGQVYAQSFIGALDNNPELVGQAVEEFDSFLTAYFDANPKFEEILSSRLISTEDKIDIINRTVTGGSPMFLNFLKVVAKHERMDCLRAMYRQMYLQYEKMIQRLPITITTAVEISDQEAEKIGQSLIAQIGGNPIIQRKVDPSLIGGVVVRVGDTVYDGSVATQLKKLRERITGKF
ncbi:MAG: ATP synthase F1 subunit delta [Thermoguttaceae bacterium]|nr:ATP synthase F1 subunit delta [Thermoguttaceae bacterium]